MLELAGKIDGFAGLYCENADLVLALAGPEQPNEDALSLKIVSDLDIASSCYNRNFPLKIPRVVIARKRYSFLTLRAWRDTIVTDFVKTAGALSIGINYTSNRVWIPS